MSEMVVVLDVIDAQTVFDLIYKGKRPSHVHTLLCSCGAQADLREDPCAWKNWMILPHPKCPDCLADERAQYLNQDPVQARARYLALLERFGAQHGCVVRR